jgi:heme-degrading monooxygenase HmoA
MARIWTHGVWTIKQGREEEFIAKWRGLIPLGESLGAASPTLLRDRERPNVFRSFSPWADIDAIEAFRAELRPRLEEMENVLEELEMFTLDEAYPGG